MKRYNKYPNFDQYIKEMYKISDNSSQIESPTNQNPMKQEFEIITRKNNTLDLSNDGKTINRKRTFLDKVKKSLNKFLTPS